MVPYLGTLVGIQASSSVTLSLPRVNRLEEAPFLGRTSTGFIRD